MTVGFIAYHYPRPDQFDDFVERTRIVRETLLKHPGCRSADIWTTPDRDAVVTIGTFDSEQAYKEALSAGRALGDAVAFDDRERKPRKITNLVSR